MKILNFGSLNIDYVYHVEDFVRKGETISSSDLNIFAGGKGLNQSIALSKSGLKVYHAGVIGEDGVFLKTCLEEAGVDTSYIRVLENAHTGNAIIQKNHEGDNCIILYSGANYMITKEMVDTILHDFGKDDWIVLQNEISELPYILEEAHKKGMKIALNPSPMNHNIFLLNPNHIDLIILNEIEAEGLVGVTSDLKTLKEKLREKIPFAEIVLTLGEEGSIYISEKEEVKQKIYKVKVEDTTAAGDTFTGYFIAGKCNHMPVKKAMEMASAASAIAVSRKGAAPSIPSKDEVMDFIKN